MNEGMNEGMDDRKSTELYIEIVEKKSPYTNQGVVEFCFEMKKLLL